MAYKFDINEKHNLFFLQYIINLIKGRRLPMFSKKTKLDAISGNSITIKNHIASSGRKDIYSVSLSNEDGDYILHWYKEYPSDEMYDAIKIMYETGTPSENFLWPIEVTEIHDDSYGYVTRIVNENYVSFSDILSGDEKFISMRATVDCVINTAVSFLKLFEKGLCYFVFEPSMLFIDCNSGGVLIGDCDMVTSNGVKLYSHMYSPRFEAPEVFLNEVLPSHTSNNFSFGVFMFMLLFSGHPYEGLKSFMSCMTNDRQKELYGKNAGFVFDEQDKSNKPINSIQTRMVSQWSGAPEYVKEYFRKSFNKLSLNEPNSRPRIRTLLKAMIRYRSSLAVCQCGNEQMIDENQHKCVECEVEFRINEWLKLDEYSIPMIQGKKIFGIQLGEADLDKALEPIMVVVKNPQDPSVVGLKNCSRLNVIVTTKSGKEKTLAFNEVAPMKAISCIKINNENYEMFHTAS